MLTELVILLNTHTTHRNLHIFQNVLFMRSVLKGLILYKSTQFLILNRYKIAGKETHFHSSYFTPLDNQTKNRNKHFQSFLDFVSVIP